MYKKHPTSAWAGNSAVRVPSSHGGSREFESLPAHHGILLSGAKAEIFALFLAPSPNLAEQPFDRGSPCTAMDGRYDPARQGSPLQITVGEVAKGEDVPWSSIASLSVQRLFARDRRKVIPLFGKGSAQTFPPWRSAISLIIANPRPAPSTR